MLEHLLSPRSVCIIGASPKPSNLANRTLSRLLQHGYIKPIHLVNPRYQSIDDRPCYASVADIGSRVDVALIALPAAKVPNAIRECDAAGIRFVVVISSGFGEDADANVVSSELASAIEQSSARLVGPNCEGIWSLPANMALTFGSAAERPALIPGPISVISQSGSIGAACMRELQDAGIGCRYFVSSGNESDLTTMDYLEFMVDEGGSQTIAMFAEGFRDGHRLRAIARRASATGIRLIALCAGASEMGRLATASHTGRIATAATVYRDLLLQAGVLQVATFANFVDAIKIAANGIPPQRVAEPTDRNGVAIVAMSGGSRALLADSCADFGVPLSQYSESTEVALDSLLPRFGYSKNPTDLTGQVISDTALFSEVLRKVIDDDYSEALLVQYANGAERHLTAQLDVFSELAGRAAKPIVVSLLGSVDQEIEVRLRSSGVVCAGDPQTAVQYLSWLYCWRTFAEESGAPPARPAPSTETLQLDSWSSCMRVLTEAGIGVPAWRIISGMAEPELAGIGYPVALKALPGTSEHKTEEGLVFLGLRNWQDVIDAFSRFRDRVPVGTPALIQEMAPASVEALLSVREDPDFGPILAIGSGGIYTERLNDLAYVQLPSTESEILSALRRRRIWDLLQPIRGRTAMDVPALVTAAQRLGEAYLSRMPAGSEFEVNPLMVGATGAGVLAVDVLFNDADRNVLATSSIT
jgi:acyl-CoA synthetase (NDP forming)